jgi:imidazolonepropionase-like amidohydrolase
MILRIAVILFFCTQIFAQNIKPTNGVSENYQPIFAFKNANIIISPNTKLENATLLIKGNRIIAVDTNLEIPVGSIVTNLDGDYIYPSFIDLYSSYGVEKATKAAYNYRPQYQTSKSGPYHWNEAVHPEISASSNFKTNEKTAKEYLSNGFGTVLTHNKDGILRGTGTLVSLSQKSDSENMLLTDGASFYSFNKGVSRQKNPSSLMGSIALIRQSFLDAEWYSQQTNQKNLSYEAINEQEKLPKIFSITNELDYNRIFKIADEFELDFIFKGNGKEFLVINDLIDISFPVIIPLSFPDSYDVSNPEATDWISLEQLKNWESAPFNPGILATNNIQFCITSDGLKNSKDFLKKLRLAVKKGLSHVDALASLTTTPASIMGIEDKLGTLNQGMLANFIIASDNIFERGTIYENWTLGVQNVISEKQLFDIRGHYTFNSKEFNNKKIIIEGNKSKPKTTFPFLDTNSILTYLKGDNVTIYTNDGNFRSTGKLIKDKIIGRYQNKEGEYFNFSLQLDSLLQVKKKVEKKEDINHTPPVNWLPNKSFGFNELPKVKNIYFKNATIWTNEKEGILINSDLIIANGKIIAVASFLDPNEFFTDNLFETIDATDLHLTSGIIDEHSHIAISRGVNEGSQAVSAEVRIGDVINPNDHNIYRQLAGGTVASQLLHGSANPIGGQSAIIKLRWGSSAEKMKIKNSDGFIKFALGENVKQSNWGSFENERFPQTRMGVEQVFYDAFYRAKSYKKSWEKYNNLSLKEKRKAIPPREDLELNALVEILNSQRFITCHSYVQSEINMLMHVADSMNFTVNTFTHILEGYKVADKMREHGAGGSTFSDWWAYKFEVNEAIPYNATLLHNAGVVTAINSDDAEMGRRLNQEAAKAIKYGGTTEEEAWKMVTLNPAKLLHLDSHMGSIKEGKDADIVLWSSNPLSVYSRVIQTYVDGKLMFDLERDRKLRKRDLKERMRIIKLMSEDKNSNQKNKPKKIKEKLYHCDTEYDE